MTAVDVEGGRERGMQQVVGEGSLWEVALTSIARRKMKKKAKESQHLFPGQQGAAEHKSDLSPPPPSLAACSDAASSN